MGRLLEGLIALLAIWHLDVVLAQGQCPDNTTLCGRADCYNSSVVPYAFNNNKWGDDGSGYSCMKVLDQGRAFSVNFKWTGDPGGVKGFPYVQLDPSRLPTQLWNVSTLHFAGKWSMLVDGTENASPVEQAAAFENISIKANVAMDMFLSTNIAEAQGITPPIEIMIWFWWVPAILPLGHATSTPEIDTVEIDGTNFSLYHGLNGPGQNVFSWLAQNNVTSTDADYSPLLRYIWNKAYLNGSLYLGQLEFGSEVMHAGGATTFSASNYSIAIYRQGDPDDPNKGVSFINGTARTTITSASATSTSKSMSTSAAAAAASSAKSAAMHLRSDRNLYHYLASFSGGTAIVLVLSIVAYYYDDGTVRNDLTY